MTDSERRGVSVKTATTDEVQGVHHLKTLIFQRSLLECYISVRSQQMLSPTEQIMITFSLALCFELLVSSRVS